MKFIAIISIAISLAACSSTRTVKEQLSVDLKSPSISVGTVGAQFDKFLSIGGLRKSNIAVNYFPNEDAVCLQYKSELITYYQFWDKANRDAFVSALEKYKEDYAQRNLGKSSRKTKRNYGTFEGYIIWQLSQYTVPAYGYPKIEIGYYFKDKSPYFSINQRKAEFLDELSQSKKESLEIMIYFTRAQADSLAALFDQQYLQKLRTGNTDKASSQPDVDFYSESYNSEPYIEADIESNTNQNAEQDEY